MGDKKILPGKVEQLTTEKVVLPEPDAVLAYALKRSAQMREEAASEEPDAPNPSPADVSALAAERERMLTAMAGEHIRVSRGLIGLLTEGRDRLAAIVEALAKLDVGEPDERGRKSHCGVCKRKACPTWCPHLMARAWVAGREGR